MRRQTAGDVLVYYANLIGYARIILFILALHEGSKIVGFTGTSAERESIAFNFVSYYLASFVGDVVDGHVARMFNQSSTFGGILDMVTDRAATCGLLGLLCAVIPEHALYFILFMLLDMASHWIHTIAAKGHHKEKRSDVKDQGLIVSGMAWLLNAYYSVFVLFGYCCISAEIMWMALLVGHILPKGHALEFIIEGLICLVRPGMLIKNVINFAQMCIAAYDMAARDAEKAPHIPSNTAVTPTRGRSTPAKSPTRRRSRSRSSRRRGGK